ncbi:MAG: hypothetical protein QM627_11230 [Luteolibacter sp.]
MKKHLIVLTALAIIAGGIFWKTKSGTPDVPPESYPLTKADILTNLKGMEGEIVEVKGGGDTMHYRSDGEMTLPYGGGGEAGPAGTTKSGVSMMFPAASDHHHVIHVYESSDGGAMLVGRRIGRGNQ